MIKNEKNAYIGQLFFDPDFNIVWSVHLGGVIVSALDAQNKYHIYNIDTGKQDFLRHQRPRQDYNCHNTSTGRSLGGYGLWTHHGVP